MSAPIQLPYLDGTFRCIEADPPWQYRDRGYNGFESVQRYRIHCPYPTMSLAEIIAMGPEVQRVTAKSAHAWIWTTKDFLEDTFTVLRAWGFEYRQIWTWLKTRKDGRPTYGMGYWGRNGTEFILFGTNDPAFKLQKASSTPNYLLAQRAGHSAKPPSAYEMIARNTPGPRLSMFQRTPRPGFECWGNQLVEA